MRFTGADTDVNIATTHPEFSARAAGGARRRDLAFIVPFKREVYRAVIEEFQDRLS